MKGVQHVIVSVWVVSEMHTHMSLHVCNQSSSIEACMLPPQPPTPSLSILVNRGLLYNWAAT